ncbi:xanthine dehydrogenase family protein molybdopterin-binding subunit [Sporomusa acidovorans]|uniref:Xanthine dehydrogenase molybdenum-binding subunit XdhA n=1 Tax=Sporomusa acidovorans (strain ATCC 49682 / DSM 3132 / Mol) TaxID=1123286 RepID=A0ABZ3JA26_SPOA4|nr:molybdopterin cofactor-binding domain-containing protein [Sporomusa acidovorans]OZC16071.1 xanthine dehydrogenase molybdenum-binding subunit [Sporomusa acidovorans DSM 3132]SDD87660.1 Aldehyde oxidase and xanthine dehydrogenase, a/b hammerhead domain [Sporomusa acidovorans]
MDEKPARNFKYVGRSIPIDDGAAKASGQIRYTGDMAVDGTLYAQLVFSPVPHGRIRSIDTAAAMAVPGVVKIYTRENSTRVKYNAQMWFAGQNASEDQELFPAVVRYVGDTVAAVVAETKEAANTAAGLIKAEFDPLPVVIDPEAALSGEVKLHDSGNPFFSMETGCGDVQPFLHSDGKNFVIEDRVETPKIHHAAMETHVCIAVPDHRGRMTVYSPCQIVYSVRLIVAKVLGVPYHKVRIIKTPIGGSFGGKQEVTLETYCAYFAKDLNRPVKIEFDRWASIVATRTRTKTIGYVKTVVTPEGRILARDIKQIVDTGAYTSNGRAICYAMAKKLFRLYRIPNQHYRAVAVHTNTAIAGAARGYGSPQVQTITEINLDNAARRLKMDPVALRLQNLVHPYDDDPSGGPNLGDARIIDCVHKGAEAFGWRQKWNRPKQTGRWRTGVGMACATHVNGYYGAYQEFGTMTIRMLEDGSIMLNAGLHDLGNGTVTAMKQIVAEVLDISLAMIEAPEADTDISPYDIGCQASRVIHVCGANAMRAAEELRDLFIREAAKIFSCREDEVTLENGRIWPGCEPEKGVSYGQMAAAIQQKNQIELIRTVTYQSPANPGSYAVNFVEVAVDTFTGFVKVTDVVAVHDVGQAINTGFVEGQIHGGIQMGLGMAISEDLDYDAKTGVARGSRFSKYHLINAPDMPPVKVILIENGGEYGPYGAKSVGEIATIPITAATVNAINHALETNLTALPVTPAKIMAALAMRQAN